MPIQRLLIIGLWMLLLLIVPFPCLAAESLARQSAWAIGWQQSRPASGLSLRCPLGDNYYLQPIILVDLKNEPDTLNQHLEFGFRGIYNLSQQTNFRPYTGFGLGYRERKKGPANIPNAHGGTGLELFFGIEYLNYPIHPGLEISLAGFDEVNGGFQAGFTGNFMLMYYF